MPTDPYAQSFPDYDTFEPVYSDTPDVSSRRRKHGNRGKLTKEGKRKQVARWRARNKGKYRAYMRQYMAARRATERQQNPPPGHM